MTLPWCCAGGVQLLAPLLRGASGPSPNQQLLYDAGLAAWQLTFYQPAAEIMGTTGEPHALARVSLVHVALDTVPEARRLSDDGP